MKKRLFVFLLVLAIVISLTGYAFADEEESTENAVTFYEYDYIDMLNQSTPQELEELGYTEEEVDEITQTYERDIAEKATMSDDELLAYGYTDEEIALLRAFASGAELSVEEMRNLGSTCTGSLSCQWITDHAAQFTYSWTWNRCPSIRLTDSSALRWIAYNADGTEIGVEQTSSSMLIDYYVKGTAAGDGCYVYSSLGTNEPNIDFNTINMQFPAWGAYTGTSGIMEDCYAKIGKVSVSIKVPTGVSQNIDHIFVAGLYGHTLLGVGAPSVSVSSGSCAISFTANLDIDAIASSRGTITQGSTNIKYW